MRQSVNAVPISETAWGVVLAVTVAACVVWLVVVVGATRYRAAHKPASSLSRSQGREPGTASRVSARVVLVVVTVVAVLAVVAFLVARAADLLA